MYPASPGPLHLLSLCEKPLTPHNASLTTLFAVGGEKLIQVGNTYTDKCIRSTNHIQTQTKPINDSWFPEDTVSTLTVQVLWENVSGHWSMFDKALCVTCMLAYVLHSTQSAMPELMWARLSQARLQGFWNECCFWPTLCSESLRAQLAVQHFHVHFPLFKMSAPSTRGRKMEKRKSTF